MTMGEVYAFAGMTMGEVYAFAGMLFFCRHVTNFSLYPVIPSQMYPVIPAEAGKAGNAGISCGRPSRRHLHPRLPQLPRMPWR